eukprot:761841-Hanusia_phi.AAC.9
MKSAISSSKSFFALSIFPSAAASVPCADLFFARCAARNVKSLGANAYSVGPQLVEARGLARPYRLSSWEPSPGVPGHLRASSNITKP